MRYCLSFFFFVFLCTSNLSLHSVSKQKCLQRDDEPLDEQLELLYALLEPLPLWVDLSLVLNNSTKSKHFVCSIDNQTQAHYLQSPQSGRIEEVQLLKENRLVASLRIRWTGNSIESFWLENEEKKILFQHQFTYDQKGQISSHALAIESANTLQESCSEAFEYDEAGRLTFEKSGKKDSAIIVHKWLYDEAGEISSFTTEKYESASKKLFYREEINYHAEKTRKICVSYHEDKIASQVILEWQTDADERILWLSRIGTDGKARTTNYEYNDSGLLVKKTKPDGISIFYEYDDNARISHLFSSDKSVNYIIHYDAFGHIAKTFDLFNQIEVKRNFLKDNTLLSEEINGNITSFEYDSKGRRHRLVLPDKSALEYLYSGDEFTAIGRTAADGTRLYECTPVASQKIVEKVASTMHWHAELQDAIGSYQHQVEYDTLGAIAKESGEFSHSYTFDALGRSLVKDGQKNVLNAFGEVIQNNSATFEYDSNGNLASKVQGGKRWTFLYDALDRLTYIVGDEIIEKHIYDLFHRRIATKKTQEGKEGRLQYLFDGDEEIGILSESKEISELKILSPLGLPLSIELNGAPYVVQTDFRGSIVALSYPKTKKVAETYRYSAFGERKIFNNVGDLVNHSPLSNPWGFFAKRTSEETGLVAFGKRDFDPDLLTWLSVDPLSFFDGVNTSAFVHNDPIRNCDPQGLFTIPIDFSHFQTQLKEALSQLYEKGMQTITFAQRQIQWFCDFRAHFEDLAFKVSSKSFWTLLGYNPDASHHASTGEQEPTKKVRLTLINGILNTQADAKDNAIFLSGLHGDVKVHYLYSATHGFTGDISRAICAKLGITLSQAKMLAKTWKGLINEMGGVDGGGTIIHYAHSLGAADTYRALHILSEEERKMIQVSTFGSPMLIPEGNCQEVKNYVSTHDAIPLFDIVSYVQALYGQRADIVFLESKQKIPLADHPITATPYSTTLEELGRKFQQQYLQKGVYPAKIEHKQASDKKFALHFQAKSVPTDLAKAYQKNKERIQGHKKEQSIRRPKEDTVSIEKIVSLIQAKDYIALGKAIVKRETNMISVVLLNEAATKYLCRPLQKAITAAQNILNLEKELGVSQSELIQLALFIESDFKKHIDKEKYFLKTEETGLVRELEYDPKTKNIFIHLGVNKFSKVGEGHHKIVTKSILYNMVSPEICANCSTSLDDLKEMGVIEQLQGTPGIVEGRAFIKHTKEKEREDKLEIIVKLYNTGSLREIFYQKKAKFSSLEKMRIALDLLRGLEGMHKKRLIHRDLHTANCLVNISNMENGQRKIDTVITDFGQTRPQKECDGKEPQPYLWYLSPEGFFFNKMTGRDYPYTDVYALGCIFYHLFYEKDPDWFNDKYFKNVREGNFKQKKRDQEKVIELIEGATRKRRASLVGKKIIGELAPIERFELLVMRMVHPEAQRRGQAAELRREARDILLAEKARLRALAERVPEKTSVPEKEPIDPILPSEPHLEVQESLGPVL